MQMNTQGLTMPTLFAAQSQSQSQFPNLSQMPSLIRCYPAQQHHHLQAPNRTGYQRQHFSFSGLGLPLSS